MSGSTISAKAKALAIIPKITGLFSLVGSIFVIHDILRRRSSVGNGNSSSNLKNGRSIYHRIMLGLSTFDAIASFVNILSTWPTPSDQSDMIFGASGSTKTCTAQGFFNELGNITTPLYSVSLCIWYLLVLKYGWREQDVSQTIEFAMHALPINIGLAMAICGLPLTLYNNSGFLCWYAPYPAGCDSSTKDLLTSCTRGELAWVFRWIHYGIVWLALGFITYALVSIYLAVRRLEGVVIEKNSILSRTARKKSRAVAAQALLYVCALYLTWIFTTCTRIAQTAFKHNSYSLLVLMAIFFPLQGFWNALIYFRIPYQQQQSRSQAKKRKRKTRLSSFETCTSTPKGHRKRLPRLSSSNLTPRLSSSNFLTASPAPGSSKGLKDAAGRTNRPSRTRRKQQDTPELENELEEGRCNNKNEQKAKPFRFSTEQRFGWNVVVFSTESEDGEQDDPREVEECQNRRSQQTLSEDEQFEI